MTVSPLLYSLCWLLAKDDVSHNAEVNNFKAEKQVCYLLKRCNNSSLLVPQAQFVLLFSNVNEQRSRNLHSLRLDRMV